MAVAYESFDRFLLRKIENGEMSLEMALPYFSDSILNELQRQEQFKDIINGGSEFGRTILALFSRNELAIPVIGNRGGELQTSILDNYHAEDYSDAVLTIKVLLGKLVEDRQQDIEQFFNLNRRYDFDEDNQRRFAQEEDMREEVGTAPRPSFVSTRP